MNPMDVLNYLAENRLLVSIVFGNVPGQGVLFSVDVLNTIPAFISFDEPFAALTYEDAVAIAYLESVKRGWCQPKPELNVYDPKARLVVEV